MPADTIFRVIIVHGAQMRTEGGGTMGFTIEDMRLVSEERYKMEFVAGRNGWSNSISWLLMLEDLTIIQHFTGKELAVTTGLGFQTEEEMLRLVEELSRHSASGLIFNTGFYVMGRDLPLPCSLFAMKMTSRSFWFRGDLRFDMIKDLSIRVFLQPQPYEQISNAHIHAIETPEGEDLYAGPCCRISIWTEFSGRAHHGGRPRQQHGRAEEACVPYPAVYYEYYAQWPLLLLRVVLRARHERHDGRGGKAELWTRS